MTINIGGNMQQPTVPEITCPVNGTGGVNWVASVGSSSAICTSSAILTSAINTSMSLAALVGGSGNTGTASASVSDASNVPVAATPNGTIGNTPITGVTGSAPATLPGQNVVFTFTVPGGLAVCSDASVTGTGAAVASDIGLTNGTLVSTTTSTRSGVNTSETVTVTVAPTGALVPTATLSTHLIGAAVGAGCTTSAAAVATVTVPELRHVTEAGAIVTGAVASQDVINNVRGARHNVCMFVDPLGNNPVGSLTAFNSGTAINLTNVQINGGGGYLTLGDVTPSFTDPIFFTWPADGSQSAGASCVSWTSTAAGDQEMSIVVSAGTVTTTIDWDSNNDGNHTEVPGSAPSPSNADIIKEWNVLNSSSVSGAGTAVSGAGTSSVVYNVTRGLTLNVGSGLNQITPISLVDSFLGSHTTRTGAFLSNVDLVGVNWTVTLAGCGTINGSSATSPSVTFSGTTTLNADGTVGNKPSVVFAAGNSVNNNCGIGSTATVTFTGTEPGALGSGPGNTVTQVVNISFTQIAPVKQVLLAWAGQRVILEHDWRLPPGDFFEDEPAGTCPIPGALIDYIKSAEGPGNLIPALGGSINGADELDVRLTGDNNQADNSQNSQVQVEAQVPGTVDAPTRPQDACISRALYESEDPGEVDVEAFIDPGSLLRQVDTSESKVAFVIYYMKFNQVQVSLVTQVAKPTHNSSSLADYATIGASPTGANPWDATKDAANNTADWNVSRDILVRGRVSGWFTNSNPSGRARDASDPQNVLPADRWVMPDDWVNIAGGSALAGSFRPSYDLMFSPANARGITMADPTGVSFVLATSVAAPSVVNPANTSVKFRIADPTLFATLLPGTGLLVGSTGASFTSLSVSNSQFYITVSGLTATPAVGTSVFIATGVPFEGPYSLIDIPGLAVDNGGNAGAALSNLIPGDMRDTILGDSVVDWWDAPMPPANITVRLRGTGFIKQVIKSDVYYLGTPNSAAQVYTNPYYITNVPGSPYISAVAAGGGYLWNSWGADGPGGQGQGVYRFWQSILLPANNSSGVDSVGAGSDSSLSATDLAELTYIRNVAYGDPSISRTMVVFSDNHGEFMVTANGDFKTDLTACAANALAGGKLCKPGDKVGVGTVDAIADYPDFKKHFPIASNKATINWLWGGYKDVTVEPGETDQFKYIVFHAIDRDGFCDISPVAGVSLHPVLSKAANDTYSFTDTNGVTTTRPAETVDFLIDSGEGIILSANGGTPIASGGTINDGKQFATGVNTYDVATAKALGLLTFPLDSPVMPAGTADECQAYIKVSNSLLGILNVLTVAHNDEGNEGFDKVIDLTGTTSYTLQFRWTLITWAGADNIPVADALKGGASTKNPGGNDISSQVTAVYGWNASSQTWLGFFPTGVNVPGANNLTALNTGQAYWVAITGPGSVTWTVTTNVGGS